MNQRKLILGLKRGDHDSYETLFDLYYVKFVNFADAILKDRTVAKDIVQEAFIHAPLYRYEYLQKLHCIITFLTNHRILLPRS